MCGCGEFCFFLGGEWLNHRKTFGRYPCMCAYTFQFL
jgi:hypothetical protein